MNLTSINWGDMKDLVQVSATVVSTAIAVIALWRQRKQAERLKLLESELDKAKFEHQTRFTRLHEKRADVIAELYRQVMLIEIWIEYVVGEAGFPENFISAEAGAEHIDKVLWHIGISQQKLANYFNLNRLYLDTDLCDKLVDFHDIIFHKIEPIEGYFYERFNQMPKEEILEHFGDNLEERAEKVLELVTDSRRVLEAEFRHLLGIQSSVKNKKNEVSSLNDLMWVPQPAMMDPIERPERPEGRIACPHVAFRAEEAPLTGLPKPSLETPGPTAAS